MPRPYVRRKPVDLKTALILKTASRRKSIRPSKEADEEKLVRRRATDPMISPKGAKHPVTNPVHYTSTKISPIEVIEDWDLGYCLGNTVKYIGREKLKGGLQDLEKAHWYLTREIQNRKKAIAKAEK